MFRLKQAIIHSINSSYGHGRKSKDQGYDRGRP